MLGTQEAGQYLQGHLQVYLQGYLQVYLQEYLQVFAVFTVLMAGLLFRDRLVQNIVVGTGLVSGVRS